MATLTALQSQRSLRRQHLWLPLGLTLLAGTVTAVLSLFLPNYYKSEVRILSDSGQAGGGAGARTEVWAPSAVPEAPGSREDGPTIIYADILKSRRMAEALLLGNYAYTIRAPRFGGNGPVLAVQGTLLEYLGVKTLDRGLGPLKSILVVQRDMKSGLLTLSAETRSPELSLQVVQRAAKLLKDYLVDISQVSGQSKAEFTQSRLNEVQAKYDQIGREFLAFQEANRDWEQSPSPSVRFRGARLKDDLELWRQVAHNLTLNHEQALLDARNDTQTLLILDPGSLPGAKSRPARSFLVFAAMALMAVLSWIFSNRALVYNRFIAKEPAA